MRAKIVPFYPDFIAIFPRNAVAATLLPEIHASQMFQYVTFREDGRPFFATFRPPERPC
jgi:hypothetical protein